MLMKPSNLFIDKYRYTLGIQCQKAFWLKCFQSESGENAALSASNLEEYHTYKFVQQLFPEGTLIPTENVSEKKRLDLTEQALRNSTVIYNACFRYGNGLIVADIVKKGKKGWKLYDLNFDLQNESICLEQLAFQYHVITDSGLPLHRALLLSINRFYIRHDAINPNRLFNITDQTVDVLAMQAYVSKQIYSFMKSDIRNEPVCEIGIHCRLSKCPFICYCWHRVPYNSVLEFGGKGLNKFQYFRSGIEYIEDIPLAHLSGVALQQVKATIGREIFIQVKALKAFLGYIKYPRCFLYVSSTSNIVPPYNGLSPYQKYGITYSLITQTNQASELYHSKFIASSTADDLSSLLERLLEEVPEDACIIIYNKTEISAALQGLVSLKPELRTKVRCILDRIIDLKEPFEKSYIYSWKQRGKSDLDSVLPAFIDGWHPDEDKECNSLTDKWKLQSDISAVLEEAPSEDIGSQLSNKGDLISSALLKLVSKIEQLVSRTVIPQHNYCCSTNQHTGYLSLASSCINETDIISFRDSE